MNSTQRFKWLGFLAGAVLAACLMPAPLNAQSVGKGNFTLPFEARWGTTVLPAGSYSFTIKSASDSYAISVRDEHARPMLLMPAYGVLEGKPSDSSHLTVVERGGKAAVRALYMEPLGITFYYPLPKGDRQVVAQVPQLNQRVPVSAAGK